MDTPQGNQLAGNAGPGSRRWLALALSLGCAVVAAGVGLVLWLRWRTDTPVPTRIEPPAHAQTPLAEATPPQVPFVDVTRRWGVDFVHVHGGYGKKLLPETMGSGVLVFDFDNDGWQDIFLVQSGYWKHHRYEKPPPRVGCALFRNEQNGHFRNVTQEVGLGDLDVYGMGAVAGDVDNDGYPDLVVTYLGGLRLFHNEKGKYFRDITEAAGLQSSGWCSAAAFLDYDRDGLLDLFVGHYVQWAPDKDLFCSLDGRTKAYCQPVLYEGEHCQLFHNRDGLHFEDVSEKAGVRVWDVTGKRPASKCLGVAVHDYNDDGWPDIAVANDTTPNFLFRNNGDGTFTNVGEECGVRLLNDRGQARGAMGIHWGYYRDGQTLGLAIANFANEMNGLLRYDRAHDLFVDQAIREGVGGPSRLPLKFGLFFFDYDLDGRLDLFTSNGHIEPEIARFQGEGRYEQPAQLFWNTGPSRYGCYREVEPVHSGPDLFSPRVGRGCACGDLDGDGDLDIVLNNNNQPATVLRNDGTLHQVIRFRFQGSQANRDGFGVRVQLWAGERMQQAELASGGSYLSQNEAILTFGLGPMSRADRVRIRWPNRQLHWTELTDLPAGYLYTIHESTGIVERRPLLPRRAGD